MSKFALCKSKSGCKRPARARGYCVGHYGKLKRGGDPDEPLGPARVGDLDATLPGPIRVPEKTAEKWRAEAEKRGIPLYELVKRAITDLDPGTVK